MQKIHQIDDCGQVVASYDSIAQAADFHECDESSIRKVLNKDGRKSCGYIWRRDDIKDIVAAPASKSNAKILLLDIETAPLLAYVFQKQVWKAHISSDKVVSDWFMLTYSCAWFGDGVVFSNRITGKEALEEDDTRLVHELWEFLNEADIVIAHNGNHFDLPNMNTRFLLHGLPPTSPYKQIDTLDVAKKQFGFTHNNLNGLAATLKLGAKIETNFDLWKRCLRGDDKALEEMEHYNVHDVELLESVYMYLRPWIKSHTTLSLYNNDDVAQCPYCGERKLTQEGHFYTLTGKYETYRCAHCGGISRDRKTILPKTKQLLISIPGR